MAPLRRSLKYSLNLPRSSCDENHLHLAAVTGSLAGLEASCAPNSCSGRGAITYLLPAGGHMRLTLYDALGRRVATIADEVQPAGRHNAWFDVGELPPGVYAWMLEFGGGRVGDRVVIVR